MDEGSLVTENLDAGAKLATEFDAQTPLSAAFWLKKSDDGDGNLYLVSDQINDTNFDLAYGQVHNLLRGGLNLWLDPFQVKVRGVDNPIAKAVIEMQQTYPSPHVRRLRNMLLGGTSVDDVFIYPMPVSVSI